MRTLAWTAAVLLLVGAPSASELMGWMGMGGTGPVSETAAAFVVGGEPQQSAATLQLVSTPLAGAPTQAVASLSSEPVTATAPVDKRTVTVKMLNLREQPSVGALIVGKLAQQTVLTVEQEAGSWLRVTTPDGTSGWVSARYVASAG